MRRAWLAIENDDHIREIFAGSRRTLRQIIRPQPLEADGTEPGAARGDWIFHFGTIPLVISDPRTSPALLERSPFGLDLALRVKEAWAPLLGARTATALYRATWTPEEAQGRPPPTWRPARLMPPWASRLTLTPTRISVGRIQDSGPWHPPVCPRDLWEANVWVWVMFFRL